MNEPGPQPRSAHDPAACPVPPITAAQTAVDNLPYVAMLGLGAAIVWGAVPGLLWSAIAATAYAAYGLAGAVWIMFFVCPHCHFYGTRLCPCGYGQIAAKLRRRGDGQRFAQQFRRHIPVIVPLWFIPVAVGIGPLVRHYDVGRLLLLLAFACNAFVLLPLVSRLYGCAKCPQKATCPWMGCKGA